MEKDQAHAVDLAMEFHKNMQNRMPPSEAMEGFSPRRGSYGSAVNSEASVEDTGKADAVPFSEGPAAEAESSAAQAAAEIPGAGQFPPQYQTLPEDLLREIDDSGPDKEECTPFKEARWDRMSANPGLFASPEQGIGSCSQTVDEFISPPPARAPLREFGLIIPTEYQVPFSGQEVCGKPKKNKQTQVDEGLSGQLVEVSRRMRGSAVTSIESSAGAQCYAEVVKELKELKERMDGNERYCMGAIAEMGEKMESLAGQVAECMNLMQHHHIKMSSIIQNRQSESRPPANLPLTRLPPSCATS